VNGPAVAGATELFFTVTLRTASVPPRAARAIAGGTLASKRVMRRSGRTTAIGAAVSRPLAMAPSVISVTAPSTSATADR